MLTSLIDAVRSLADIPHEQAGALLAIAHHESLKKGDHFINEGNVPTRFALNVQGLFRYYYIHPRGSEFTKGFFPEKNFITSYTAMIRSMPSPYAIQALEDSEIVVVNYSQWKVLYDKHPCWMHFVFALLQKGYIKKEARERELLLLSAEERYQLFLHEFPHLEVRLKQHMIASYLGITPVALSRIRKQT